MAIHISAPGGTSICPRGKLHSKVQTYAFAGSSYQGMGDGGIFDGGTLSSVDVSAI